MRMLIITLAATASALAAAAPAAAQYFPQPQPQGYAYGYNNYGQVRALQARVDHLQGYLDRLAQRRMISREEYVSLHRDSHRIEQRLRAVARYGLGGRERYDIERRIVRLEQRIAYEVRDGRGWNRGGDYHGSNDHHGSDEGYYGQGDYEGGYDRDRDGLDDRYEDDRGRVRDE